MGRRGHRDLVALFHLLLRTNTMKAALPASLTREVPRNRLRHLCNGGYVEVIDASQSLPGESQIRKVRDTAELPAGKFDEREIIVEANAVRVAQQTPLQL